MIKNKHLGLKKANIRRTCRIMFLCFTLGIGVCFSNNSYSQSTKISLNLKNKTIKQVFSEIEKNSEFIFFYQDDILNADRKVTVNADNETIEQILNEVLSATGNTYFVSDRSIYIIKKASGNIIHEENVVQQQKKQITGTVTDKEGEAIIGANIVEKGTTNGTVTDIDGRFSLGVENDAVLSISYIGYVMQEINTAGKGRIDVILQEDQQGLEELVVIGYGTQRKVNLTGAVSQITAEDMKDRPITKMTQALQGVIPNLNITFGSGQPGTSGSLNIRGTTSINGGSPLVLIDGVPGNIDRINVNDVASISVLKDASASAVYGARAAFGVILITTKTPKAGKMQINYQNNFAWTTHATKTDFITDGYTNAKINDDAFYRGQASHLFRYTEEDWAEMESRIGDKTENPDRPWVVVKQVGGRDRYNYYGN
ncbi:MAG: TonB-dependent receptor plug domain-containing protein, partial [Proteiniphilum sp.]|nr:TonB-dependent receptor plug domain-containing protein [Proteiniphilum sp.]